MIHKEHGPLLPIDISDTLAKLHGLLQIAHQLGNNDYESGAIQRIISEVQAGRMDAQEGIRNATEIVNSKNER